MSMTPEARKKIEIWMKQRDITRKQICDDLGVSAQMISAFFLGKTVSNPIASWLKKRRCPSSYFKGTRYDERRAA